MMNRVCFRRVPGFREKLSALFAPRRVRRAIQIAQTISFEPDITQHVREAAILRLRNRVGYDRQHFRSAEALSVLAVMDTLQAMLPDLARQARQARSGDGLNAASTQRELDFHRSVLTICALYMRRSGHMNQQMLGASLYQAAGAIETIYAPLPRRDFGARPPAFGS